MLHLVLFTCSAADLPRLINVSGAPDTLPAGLQMGPHSCHPKIQLRVIEDYGTQMYTIKKQEASNTMKLFQ
jgi:hypothetical protein